MNTTLRQNPFAFFAPFALFAFILFTPACSQPPSATPTPDTLTPTPTETAVPIGINFVTLAPPTAAVFQIPPSPLPPPSSTPTPTPIIHTITEGDTLLQLAIDNRTTVTDIEALNPGINPRLLSIGQEVVLPPPATPIFAGEQATPIPTQLTINSLTFYETPLGSLWILGDVLNEGTLPAENIRLELTLFGENGLFLGRTTVWTVPTVVLPQQTAPFGLLLTDPPAAVEQLQGTLIQSNTLPDQPPQPDGLALTYDIGNIQLEESAETEGQLTISGTLTNTAALPVTQTMLIATLTNSQGQVTGYNQLQLADPLPAGATIPFTMTVTPPGGTAAAVTFNAQGIYISPTTQP